MHGLFHTLNISTLATWISVAGFGGVAVLAPEKQSLPILAKPLETQLIQEDFTLGEQNPVENPAGAPSAPEQTGPAEILPAPPELPELTETAPLPEIPELPVPAIAPPAPTRTATPVIAARRNPEIRPQTGSARTGTGSSSASGPRASASGGGTGTLSESSRLAAGRMPPPSYPAEAKRKNQTGTVVVEFTVDSNGRVISAYAKSSSSWPLLDSEALRTVRRWKFPAGPVMKLQRPIVFQLR
jgi:TonB family protein